MKKIIAVTAGLLLAGSIVGSAQAADSPLNITFSGDARARFNYESNYLGLASGAPVLNAVTLPVINAQGKRLDVPAKTSNDFWNSRIRLQFKIDTKGGAYAVGRFRIADGTWEGNNMGANSVSPGGGGTTGGSEGYATNNTKSNIWADIGYIGVPMGPIVVEGGLGYDDFTNDFFRAGTTDNYTFLRGKYANDQTTIYAFYEKLRVDPLLGGTSTYNSTTGVFAVNATDNQNDIDQYGVNWTQKFNKDWSLNGTILYRDDQLTTQDYSGVAADVLVNGNLPNGIKLWVELAYKQSDYQRAGYASTNYSDTNTYQGLNSGKDGWSNMSTTGDDGYGGYIAAKFPLGAGFAISAMAGATFDGYTASPDFGGGKQADYAPFVMLSQPTTKDLGFLGTGVLVGSAAGNAYFINVAPSVKPTDRLTLTVEGTYMNAEYGQGTLNAAHTHWSDGVTSLNFWEVGGIASYKVTDGAAVNAMVGYLNIEDADNNPIGFGLALDVKF